MKLDYIDSEQILFLPSAPRDYDGEKESFISKLFKKKPQDTFYESRIKEIGKDTLYTELDNADAFLVKNATWENTIILTPNYLIIPKQEIFKLSRIQKFAMANVVDAPFQQYAEDRFDKEYDPNYISEYEGEESFELDRFNINLLIVDDTGLGYKYTFPIEVKDRQEFHDLLIERSEADDFTPDDVLEGEFETEFLMSDLIQ